MANRDPTAEELNNVKQDIIQWEAKAKRILNVDESGNEIGIQYPLQTDGDSVYVKDIDKDEHTTIGTFTGDILSLFNDYDTEISDVTTTNPKTFTIRFARPISGDRIGMGSSTSNFSNVKILLKDLSGTTRVTLDDSANDTKYTSNVYTFRPNVFIEMVVEFHTTDSITLNGMYIPKSINTISAIQAIKDDGTLTTIGATNSSNLRITDAENGLAIAKGDVANTTFIHKFGTAPDFDTGDGFVTIWDGADDAGINQMIYQYSTTNDIDSLSGSNNSDTQDIEVQGLDINYELVTQIITLTGQIRKALDTPLIRIFRLKNVSNTDILGQIYCYVNTAIVLGVPTDTTKIRAAINNGNNQTLMGIYTIPAGKTGYMRDWYASTAGAKKVSQHTIKLRARPFGQVFQLKHVSNIAVIGSSYIQHQYEEPEVFTEKTDIEMSADTDQDIAGVAAGFDIVLIDN